MLGLTWAFATPANGQRRNQQNQEEDLVQGNTIEAVLKRHTDSLMSLPGVVGTGQGECSGKPCIKVLVITKTPGLLEKIPSSIEGYLVEIQETGEIRPLDSR